MRSVMTLFVTFILLGCQSTPKITSAKQTKQPENYTHVVCNVKKQNVGGFSETITFDKNFQTVTIGNDILICLRDKYEKCKAKIDTPSGYVFYKINVYTYKYRGSGFLYMAEIKNKMLVNAAYAELECNHK